MNIEIENLSPVVAKMKIVVPAKDVNERMAAYFTQLSKKARIPGFRPGKAPAQVVKKFYGEDSAQDLSERLISEYVLNAVREKDLHLVLPPSLVATDLPQEDKDFRFEVEVDLRPKLPKLNLKSITVEGIKSEPVTDAEVQAELEQIRDRTASFVDIKETRAATKDDCVVVSFEGSVDGKVQVGMQSESQTIVLGKGQFLPDFEAAVIGMKPGEEKTFDMTFPADYYAKELQAKTATFKVSLKGIKEKQLPEMNDEFAKEVDSEVETLEALKQKTKERLESTRKKRNEDNIRDQIGDALVSKHSFEVSKRQVQQMAQKIFEQTHQMMHQMGVQHEENEEHLKSLFETSVKRAERDIRLGYLLAAIAEEHKIEVSKEDIEKRYEETAKKTGNSVAQIKAYYSTKDQEGGTSRLDNLISSIQDEKSLDYALSQATIKNRG